LLQLGISEEDTFIQKIVVKVFAQKVCKQSVPVPSAHKKPENFCKVSYRRGSPAQQSTNSFNPGYLEDTFIQEIVVEMCVQKVCKRPVPIPRAHKKAENFCTDNYKGPQPNNLVIATTMDICRKYTYA
jgi:hypothetical protein